MESISKPLVIRINDRGLPEIQGLEALGQSGDEILSSALSKNSKVQQMLPQAIDAIERKVEENIEVLYGLLLRERSLSKIESIGKMLETYEKLQTSFDESIGNTVKAGFNKVKMWTKKHPRAVKAIALAIMLGISGLTGQNVSASDIIGTLVNTVNSVNVQEPTKIYGTVGVDFIKLTAQYIQSSLKGNEKDGAKAALNGMSKLIGGLIMTPDGKLTKVTEDYLKEVMEKIVRAAGNNVQNMDLEKIGNAIGWLKNAIFISKAAVGPLSTTSVPSNLKQPAMKAADMEWNSFKTK